MINEFKNEYRFLSNFWLHRITYKDKIWPSNEHAYQAAKTLDVDIQEKIRLTPDARDAKKLGRQLVIRPDWDEIKDSIMLDINRIKFSDPELKAKLEATGTQELIEGNWWGDTYWGICRGVGQNKLGKILMQIRQENRNGQN